MKECVECGKKLGVMEGYRHPVMGKDYLVCKNCFDTVSASVEKYQEFLSAYNGFFKKETSVTEDIQEIEKNIVKSIEKMQNRVRNILTKNASQNNNEVSFAFH